jgi:hypothetical protein
MGILYFYEYIYYNIYIYMEIDTGSVRDYIPIHSYVHVYFIYKNYFNALSIILHHVLL